MDEESAQTIAQTQINLNLLAQQLADIRVDIREVRNQVSAMNRPDRATLISLGLFIILCGGGLWGLAIRPIDQRLDSFATKESVDFRINGITKDLLITQEHLKEQENKFVTKEQQDKLQYEIQKRLPK